MFAPLLGASLSPLLPGEVALAPATEEALAAAPLELLAAALWGARTTGAEDVTFSPRHLMQTARFAAARVVEAVDHEAREALGETGELFASPLVAGAVSGAD